MLELKVWSNFLFYSWKDLDESLSHKRVAEHSLHSLDCQSSIETLVCQKLDTSVVDKRNPTIWMISCWSNVGIKKLKRLAEDFIF
jgi:hypothetical protein